MESMTTPDEKKDELPVQPISEANSTDREGMRVTLPQIPKKGCEDRKNLGAAHSFGPITGGNYPAGGEC
jgi:hypothetical protein